MTTIAQDNNKSITIEQAQELLTNKQADVMQEAEKFVNHLISSQEDQNKKLITQDDQDQAENLLNTI